MRVYYNDSDPFVCAWLKNLIAAKLLPAGDVDERPIEQVQASDVAGYPQAHFFAGIGGWPYALQLAGWGDRPVWTGSCPCPAFSVAGRGRGFSDPRHLWPQWIRLIRECGPPIVFGEQVEGAIGHGWLDLVAADLEAAGYAFAATVLGAHSAGAPHIRQRLWFVADASRERRDGERLHVQQGRPQQENTEADGCRATVAHPNGLGLEGRQREVLRERASQWVAGSCGASAMADSPSVGRKSRRAGDATQGQERRQSNRGGEPSALPDTESGGASTGRREQFAETRTEGRRVAEWAIEPDVGRVVDGVPGRVGFLRGLGNAIVPQVAAAFVSAYMDVMGGSGQGDVSE